MLETGFPAGQGQNRDVARKRFEMLPSSAIVPLLLFALLMLMLSLHGLAAAGHFPYAHRAPPLRSAFGAVILFGTLGVAVICLGAGLYTAWAQIPWYAAVIGAGVMVLLAPLILQLFPDRVVDGRAALIGFATIETILALMLFRP